MLRGVDLSLAVFHTVLILFNLAGWAHPKTRRVHLVVISLTILSWFGLGFFYGFGYCPCTDWHWDVKAALGERGLPASWVKYYVDWITGLRWNPVVIDTVVGVSGVGALAASVVANYLDLRRRRRAPRDPVRPPAGRHDSTEKSSHDA